MNKTGDMLKSLRKQYDVSQKKLSEFAYVSETMIEKFEAESRIPAQKTIDRLFSTLEKLNPSIELEIKIDFLRVRFKTNDLNFVVEKILRIKKKHLSEEDRAFYGYEKTYLCGYIRILYSDRKDYGVLVEMTGKACRQFDGFLQAQRRTWYDFFSEILESNMGVFKRLDLAIDDRYGLLDVPFLIRKCHAGECVGLFKSFKTNMSGTMVTHMDEKMMNEMSDDEYSEFYDKKKKETERTGSTLYIGSLKSELYFCIYEKDYEQMVKEGVAIEEADIKNRFEIRLKDERAYRVAVDLVANENIEETAFSIINRYIRFADRDDELPRSEWKTNKDWELFIMDRGKEIRLGVKAEHPTLDSKYRWLGEQVVPTWAMLLEIERRTGKYVLEQMVKDVEFTKEQMAFIEQYTLPFEELITD